MIKSLQTGKPLYSLQLQSCKPFSNGLLYYSELSPPWQLKVEIKRVLLATYWINIRDLVIGDVMWCGADDHTADSAKPETKDPRSPCLHAQPYFVRLPFNPTTTPATPDTHMHTHKPPLRVSFPPELLTPWENHHCSPHLQL